MTLSEGPHRTKLALPGHLSVEPVGRDDAAHHGIHGTSGGHRQGSIRSRVTDLT